MSPIPRIARAPLTAKQPDALVIVAQVRTAAAIVQGVASVTTKRWFIAPTLKTDALIRNLIPGALENAVGVSPAPSIDSSDFARAFSKRWSGEQPTIESFFYFDAVILFALALESQQGNPDPVALRARLIDVSRAATGASVGWYDIAAGLEMARSGVSINYRGASGSVDLNDEGAVGSALVQIWRVQDGRILDAEIIFSQAL